MLTTHKWYEIEVFFTVKFLEKIKMKEIKLLSYN